jgi:hypothetical protein
MRHLDIFNKICPYSSNTPSLHYSKKLDSPRPPKPALYYLEGVDFNFPVTVY